MLATLATVVGLRRKPAARDLASASLIMAALQADAERAADRAAERAAAHQAALDAAPALVAAERSRVAWTLLARAMDGDVFAANALRFHTI